MKIQVDSYKLARACSLATKNIPNKVTMPIIENLHIMVVGEMLKITSTDTETWVVYEVPATIERYELPNAFCINAANFTSLLMAIPSQPVTIEVLERKGSVPVVRYAKITHTCGTSELPVANADEYPILQPITSEGCSVSADVLKKSIQTCRFCMFSDAEAKPALAAICLDFKGGSMVAVASDGNIFARLEHPDIQGEAYKCLLPPKAIGLLSPALDDVLKDKEAIDVVMIRKNSNMVCIQTQSASIYFRQIEQRYPNYDAVIPKRELCSCEAVMNRMDLISAVTRASLFAPAASMVLKFSFDGCKDYLTIRGEDVDFSTSGEEKVTCEFNSSKILTIGLKATFIKDILSHISSEQVRFSMIDATRAVIITEEKGNPNLLMMQMPMLLR